MALEIFTDGSGNGKYIYAIPERNIVKIFRKQGLTNNEAEYYGVISALKQNDDKKIIILSDSRLVVEQLNKRFKLKELRMKKLAKRVWKLCEGRNVKFEWVPREMNVAGRILG